jgi:CRISPR/Cas system-associated endoribonuclease Cas2
MYGQPSGFHPGGHRRHRRDSQQKNSISSIQNSTVPGPSTSQNKRELLEKVNRAVEKARREIIAAGECVTAWKVSQDAMLTLKVDSWSSLGFAMQEVPNLRRLMFTEGKVMWEPHLCFFLFFLFSFFFFFWNKCAVWLLRKWRNSGK